MLQKFRNSAIFPSWVDDFFAGYMFPNFDAKINPSIPAVNIKESDNMFTIEVAAPGMDKSNFKLDLNHNVLAISAIKEEEKEDGKSKITRREFNYTSFNRSFTLPTFVNSDDIKSTYDNGILIITIPKKEELKSNPSKQINIE